ncbi:rifin PIR protein, putative [Plasmodium reichenowi]|uniref:Rifin PIR protein, putative n=1 Tax=Plasmodium reichenowi TaxID=5854 RepID=A0A2P9DCK2_PLARE|nr:rifin PIR protein, putative [Plasmodium reichenowi]
MKLHYSKILLFFILLIILVHNKNKIYITPRDTPTYTSRVLSERDTQSSRYDNDEEIKLVKENFDRQTSQRLREYDERLQDKRQKHKEERDKNIQKIIEKDKMDKSLAEKVEKSCLRCGCALGGGVLPVWGLVSGLWYATWSQYLSAKALPAGIKAGVKEGLAQIIQIVERSRRTSNIPITVTEMLSSGKFTNGVTLYDMVQHISSTMYDKLGQGSYSQYFLIVDGIAKDISITEFNRMYAEHVAAVANAVEKGKATDIAVAHAENAYLYSAIGYSFLAILIIVLVMIIIYLVLRYRRKKKMNKKAQYTKLLNQ